MVAVGERGLLALADAGERLLEDIGRLLPLAGNHQSEGAIDDLAGASVRVLIELDVADRLDRTGRNRVTPDGAADAVPPSAATCPGDSSAASRIVSTSIACRSTRCR